MTNKIDNDLVVIDLRAIFYQLLRKMWIILLVTVVGAGGTFFVSKYLMTPLYTSSTKVYLINRQEDNRTTYSDLQMGTQLTKDYSILVRGRQLLEEVIAEYNLGIEYEEFAELVKVNTPEDTRILEIMVSYDDPELARTLAERISKLSSEKMINIMDMREVNILEVANLPTIPSSPNILKNTILGGLIGFTLTTIIFIMKYLFNDTIKNTDDIENNLNITVLGLIPLDENKVNKKSKKHEFKKKNVALF